MVSVLPLENKTIHCITLAALAEESLTEASVEALSKPFFRQVTKPAPYTCVPIHFVVTFYVTIPDRHSPYTQSAYIEQVVT